MYRSGLPDVMRFGIRFRVFPDLLVNSLDTICIKVKQNNYKTYIIFVRAKKKPQLRGFVLIFKVRNFCYSSISAPMTTPQIMVLSVIS